MPGAGLQEVKRERSSAGFISRTARAIAPGFMARRERALTEIRQQEIRRRAIEELDRAFQFGGYAGASKSRGQSQWAPGGGSADEDTLGGLHELRERSRDMIRNDPHASGMVDTWADNIVGQGLTPQSKVDFETIGITEEQAQAFQKAAEKSFKRWSKQADVTGLQSFEELTELSLRQVFENGDVFTIPRRVEGRRYSLALETVEADRVTTPTKLTSNPSVREGVAIGAFGEPLAYWVKRTHPGDVQGQTKSDDFVRIPLRDPDTGRRNVFHLYRPLRPGQSRGVPSLAPALPMFRDLQQYFKAELIGAKVAACYALFITTPDPYGDAARSTTAVVNNKQQELLEPGMIRRLNPGEDVKGFEPNRPASNFDLFITRVLRSIGVCVGTPYELVSMDFSKTTYTSGRMALTEIRRKYRKFQNWLAQKFCQPIWEMLMTEAFLMGELPAPGFFEFFEEYTACSWVGPGWSWVDPQKEVTATIQSLQSNLSTLADECSARGLNWEDVLTQRSRETKLAKELGVEPAVMGAGGGQANENENEDPPPTE